MIVPYNSNFIKGNYCILLLKYKLDKPLRVPIILFHGNTYKRIINSINKNTSFNFIDSIQPLSSGINAMLFISPLTRILLAGVCRVKILSSSSQYAEYVPPFKMEQNCK